MNATLSKAVLEPDASEAATALPIPAGWKLVPIEPTTEMWEAGLAFMYRDIDSVWAAMVEAAPSAFTRSK